MVIATLALAGQLPVEDMACSDRHPASGSKDVFCIAADHMSYEDESKTSRYHLNGQQDMLMLSEIPADSNQCNTEAQQDKPDLNPRLGEPT